MEWLRKIFGQKIINYFFLVGIGIIFIIQKDNFMTSEQIGYIILAIGFLRVIHEAYLRYLIKFKKNTKEFKSDKEKFIADYLDKKKIKYIYEKSLELGKQKIKPDFYLPEYDVYVEYWGKWDTNFEYRKECNHKRQLFKKYEYPLIELYPDNLKSIHQLDWKFTERLLTILKKDRT